jgi:membrane fusion protein
MPDGLFRREVFDAKSTDWLGEIKVASPPSHWVFSALAIALVATGLLFLTFGHFTRQQTVTGILVPSLGLLSLSAPSVGTVRLIFVHDGDAVAAGQKLMTISGDVDSTDMGLMDALVIQSLQAQKTLLQQDIDDQNRLAAAQRTGLENKIALLNSQLTQIEAQIGIQRQEVSVTEGVLEKFQKVGTGGFVSGLQMQQQESTVYQAQSQLKSFLAQHDQISQQLMDARDQLLQLPLDVIAKQNETQSKLADINQALAKSAANQSLVLTAPEAGTISAVATTPGQAITAGQPVLSITPTGGRLQAQFLVPSNAIGFLHPGSRLNLRFEAFPYQEFGQPQGTVISISSSALTPSEVAGLTEQRTDDPLYRVIVSLDQQSMAVYGKRQPLLAGLKLEASFALDRRRLIQWVFEPVIAAGHNVFGGAAPAGGS